MKLQPLELILERFLWCLGKNEKVALKKLDELKNHGQITGGNIHFWRLVFIFSKMAKGKPRAYQ